MRRMMADTYGCSINFLSYADFGFREIEHRHNRGLKFGRFVFSQVLKCVVSLLSKKYSAYGGSIPSDQRVEIGFVWLTRLASVFLLGVCFSGNVQAEAGGGCQTGAEAIANAYVRSNPLFAYYFGSLESYVDENRRHFVDGADAIVCAKRLAQAFAKGSIPMYSRKDQIRREQLNSQIGQLGISPQQSKSSPAADMFLISQRLNKLAYALPHAARGNYDPLYLPRNEIEQAEVYSHQLLGMLLRDPSIASVLETVRPTMVELADIEFRMVINAAGKL